MTTDKIFLLSVVEAESYFKTDEARKAYATLFAVSNGVYSYNFDISAECTTSNYQVNKCLAAWWLRSPGRSNYSAAIVGKKGNVGGGEVNADKVGVRPALRLSL